MLKRQRKHAFNQNQRYKFAFFVECIICFLMLIIHGLKIIIDGAR